MEAEDSVADRTPGRNGVQASGLKDLVPVDPSGHVLVFGQDVDPDEGSLNPGFTAV